MCVWGGGLAILGERGLKCLSWTLTNRAPRWVVPATVTPAAASRPGAHPSPVPHQHTLQELLELLSGPCGGDVAIFPAASMLEPPPLLVGTGGGP